MNSQFLSPGRTAVAAILMVLSASAVLAQVKTLDVQGTFDGHGIGVVQFPSLQAAGSGGGSATHIGRFTYTLHATVDLIYGTSTGVFLLVFNNGDVIHGSFTGLGGPTADPKVGHIVEYLTINGGTGRFQGATGALTLDRTVDQTTLPVYESDSGTMTGTITTPK